MKKINKHDFINIVSLSAIQGGNALFPLLLFPYLLSTVGSESFSKIVMVESIIFYVLTLTLYGFEITGVKQVSRHTYAKDMPSAYKYYSHILFTRLLIFTTIIVILLNICIFFFDQYTHAFLAWSLFPLGMILQSNYYFQGTENNLPLAIAVVLSRVSSIVVAFYFVRNTSDSIFAIYVISVSYLTSGIISSIYIFSRNNSKILLPNKSDIKLLLTDGWYIFYGNLSTVLYRGSNILILSWVTRNPDAVSIYSISEKYTKMFQALSRPLNQLYFSKTVNALTHAKASQRLIIIWKNTKLQIILLSIIVVLFLILVFSDAFTLKLFFHKKMAYLLLIMMTSIFFGIANFMFGSVGLNTIGKDKYLSKSILTTGIISVMMCFFLSKYISLFGAGISFMFAELLLLFFILSAYKH